MANPKNNHNRTSTNNKMLIDATHPEETRVVVLRNDRVEEFDYESAARKLLRGNIYLAKVTRVEPSLQAAFVDYGGNRHGFLAFNEIHPDYYQIPIADRRALIEAEAAEEAEAAARADAEVEADCDADDPIADDKQSDLDDVAQQAADQETAGGHDHEDDPDIAEAIDVTEFLPPETGSSADPSHQSTRDEPAGAPAPTTEEVAASEDTPPEPGETAPDASDTPEDTNSGPSHMAAERTDRDPVLHAADGDATDTSSEDPAGITDTADTIQTDAPLGSVEAGIESDSSDAQEAKTTDPEPQTSPIGDDDGADGNGDENGNGDSIEEVATGDDSDAMEEVPVRPRRRQRAYKIQEVIKRKQVILIQVVKEERGNKGAALTTYLSLAGRYTVLMPNTARGGGISRKITNPQDRKRLKAIAEELDVPEGMGLIIRTAGASRTKQEIRRDFEYLLRLWESVRELTLQSTAPSLVYEEGNLVKRSIRDLYGKEVDEIVVAGETSYREAKDFMRMLMPSHVKNVSHYTDSEPLFTSLNIERQLNAMFSPYVYLRSGGYLVINQTEALVAVDVNSGKATREFSIEETALNTNLEAAEELARQLKLRDLAGLIVIDFIDMEEKRNNRAVERRLKEVLRNDRARIQVGHISHFGLLEMSRQRMRTGVLEGSTSQCPHCQGTGIIRSTESVALGILRALDDALANTRPVPLIATTTAEVALYLLNNKRQFIIDMEQRYGVNIAIQASEKLQGSEYNIDHATAHDTTDAQDGQGAVSMDWNFSNGDGRPAQNDKETRDADGRRPRRRRRRRTRTSDQSDRRRSAPAIDDDQDDSDLASADLQSTDDNEQREATADDAGDAPRPRRRGRRGGRRNRRTRKQDTAADTQSSTEEADGENIDAAAAANDDAPDRATPLEPVLAEDATAKAPDFETPSIDPIDLVANDTEAPATSIAESEAASDEFVNGELVPHHGNGATRDEPSKLENEGVSATDSDEEKTDLTADADRIESDDVTPVRQRRQEPVASEPVLERIIVSPTSSEDGSGASGHDDDQPAKRGWWQRRPW